MNYIRNPDKQNEIIGTIIDRSDVVLLYDAIMANKEIAKFVLSEKGNEFAATPVNRTHGISNIIVQHEKTKKLWMR